MYKTYFIYCEHTKTIKIGKSSEPETRLKAIQTCCPTILTLLAVINRDIETRLHNKFKDIRHHGEWFKAEPKLFIEIINLLKNNKEEDFDVIKEFTKMRDYDSILPHLDTLFKYSGPLLDSEDIINLLKVEGYTREDIEREITFLIDDKQVIEPKIGWIEKVGNEPLK